MRTTTAATLLAVALLGWPTAARAQDKDSADPLPSWNDTAPFMFQWDESFDVGSDTGTPVDDKDYQCPFPFTGKFNRLTIQIGPSQMMPAEKKGAEKKIGERD